MFETSHKKAQQAKTAVEFFHEKFADGKESEPVWIDPEGDIDEPGKHRFVAGQTGGGKSTQLVELLDDEDADGEGED